MHPLRGRSRFLLLSLICLPIGIGGGVAYLRFTSSAEAGEESAAASLQSALSSPASAFAAGVAVPVAAAPALHGTLVIRVHASGQAQAWQETVVTPLVAGRIQQLPARESAGIAAGEPVVILDPVEYSMRVEEAAVALRGAEASFREMTLFDDEISDPRTRAERERFARARSGLESAELVVRRAEYEFERTRITAPIGGRIADIRVVPGEWVTPGTELMTIVDLDPIRVEVQVLEGEVGYLATGRNAHVSFAAFPGELFQGRIASINPVVESGTRTARVTVLVPNHEGRILPGMYARVALDAREYADRVMVPRTAILERDRRTMLFVFEGAEDTGRAKWRYVTTGLENETHVEILADVATDSVRAGERVLVDGHFSLIHDAQVQLTADLD